MPFIWKYDRCLCSCLDVCHLLVLVDDSAVEWVCKQKGVLEMGERGPRTPPDTSLGWVGWKDATVSTPVSLFLGALRGNG